MRDWLWGLKEQEMGTTPEILTGTNCLVMVFVEVGNKGKELYLVRRRKIMLGSECVGLD